MSEGNKGNLGTCERLQKIFDLLLDMKPHTTEEINLATRIQAVGSTCSEIRRSLAEDDLPLKYAGYSMPKAKYEGMSKDKAKIYSYRLELVGQQSFLETGYTGRTAVLK